MKVTPLKYTSLMSSNILIIRLVALMMVSQLSFGQGTDDAKVKALVSACEKSMGGQKAYNKTRHISWNFFGVRTLWWDKHTGDVRIEIPKDKIVLLWNSQTNSGKATKEGEEVIDETELSKMMTKAKGIWINDSYWLVMPFKLNDPGVNKKYLGVMETVSSKSADVIEITFNEVGVTPQNKYHIYFDKETHLVSQWDFYRNANDDKPGFSMPWQDYKPYGKIMLSGDRGERKLSNISVEQELSLNIYSDFNPISF